MTDQSLGPEQRLRKRADFDRMRAEGRSRTTSHLVLRVAPNGLPHPRYGVVVSKRVAPKAVERNRLRRRLREVLRRNPARAGWDILIIARGSASTAGFEQLREAVLNLERRLDVQGEADGQGGRAS
ncbi:MAG: ribonuclease P protein component [Chloroflexota bacterium]